MNVVRTADVPLSSSAGIPAIESEVDSLSQAEIAAPNSPVHFTRLNVQAVMDALPEPPVTLLI